METERSKTASVNTSHKGHVISVSNKSSFYKKLIKTLKLTLSYFLRCPQT